MSIINLLFYRDCEKLRPCIRIEPGEAVTLCDVEGPGMLTHMWFTGYTGHSFILRIYWEENENPSVEAPVSAFFGCAYDENFKDREGNKGRAYTVPDGVRGRGQFAGLCFAAGMNGHNTCRVEGEPKMYIDVMR